MSNTLGKNIKVTLFGESHGPCIGAVLDGFPGGVKIDEDILTSQMNKRKAVGKISTSRKEEDIVEFISGVKDGVTEGTPITLIIKNNNVRKEDYTKLDNIPRPSHADYVAHIKYGGNEDRSGGGHFSGRLTAPLVACGALAMQVLNERGIEIGTHLKRVHVVEDREFSNIQEDIKKANSLDFAVLDDNSKDRIIEEIERAKENNDSVGGILETAIINLPVGLGEPTFETLEGSLANAIFSIPAVKGVEFGGGFEMCDKYGSEVNDAFIIENGSVKTSTNYSGGIQGGISNGMPIIIRTAVKPTPSIGKTQHSVNLDTMEECELNIVGRHDPCIVHRARVVVDSICALTILDFLKLKEGDRI